jgi:hypothetical protein
MVAPLHSNHVAMLAHARHASGEGGSSGGGGSFFGADGFGFDDLLDIVNPLQHLPIVSTIYRAITGDEISTGARIVGSGVYGGAIGVMSAVADEAFAGLNDGERFGDMMLSWFVGDDMPDAAPVMVAEAQPPPAAVASPAAAPAAPTPQVAPQPTAMPQLSASSFDTLMQGLSAEAADTGEPRERADDARAAYAQALETMRANLDRYQATPRS